MGEVYEGFASGQQGSSMMPHKKNPIGLENLTGIARILRAHVISALENIALWHERDISHSCVERVIFPDGFILLDYAVNRMADIIEHFVVHKERMKENMNLSQGQLFSSHLLVGLLKKGISRQKAYPLIQRLSHGLRQNQALKDIFLEDAESKDLLSKKEIEVIFSSQEFLKNIKKRMEKILD